MSAPAERPGGAPPAATAGRQRRTVIYWRNTLGAQRRPSRGRRQHPLGRIREDIPLAWRLGLTLAGLGALLLLWVILAAESQPTLVPSPAETWGAVERLWHEDVLLSDIWASCRRILIGYSISMAIAVVLGLAMGAFASVDSFVEPAAGFVRYVPATALVPLLLFWLGIDETPKVTLIVIGTVFFNVLMVADVVRGVPREMVKASYTLGAGRLGVLRRVLLPHSVPGIIDVARINLAAAWAILVVAEVLGAQEGLAYRIIQAQRFRQVDEMFAILIIFGLIGVASDLSLRVLRRRVAPWSGR